MSQETQVQGQVQGAGSEKEPVLENQMMQRSQERPERSEQPGPDQAGPQAWEHRKEQEERTQPRAENQLTEVASPG